MSSVAKGHLKAHMLEYFRVIEKTGEPLIVTDHRNPVLKIMPYRKTTKLTDLFTDIRDKVKINGDLTAPTTNEWDEV
jgi:antitoxin (DNA-binding transcriptional repressor) of toxin-antitoxin stability system